MVQRQQLTEDQDIILEHIVEHIASHGYSPTFRDTADFTGFTESKVQRTVEKCIKLKYLRRKPLMKNGLKIGRGYHDS